jgi:capsular polysaccharide biosynthesis protein
VRASVSPRRTRRFKPVSSSSVRLKPDTTTDSAVRLKPDPTYEGTLIQNGHLRSTLIRLRESYRDTIPAPLLQRLPPEPQRFVHLIAADDRTEETRSHGSMLLYKASARPQPHRAPLAGYPQRWEAFEGQPIKCQRHVFVAKLEDVSVSGTFPAVIGRDGRLFVELSRVHDEPIETHPVYARLRLPGETRLAGKTLLLASAYGGSFYHWLTETLPRFRLLERARVPLASFDHVILPAMGGPFIEESLAFLPELRAERHVLNDWAHYRAEELIGPSLPHPVGEADRWSPPFLRRTILGRGRSGAGTGRLLLSRSSAPRRRLVNENQIWHELLKPAGFRKVSLDDLPLSKQAEIVSRARTIVAPHGAALTHMIFAHRGCSIIELLSQDYPATCFWNLANALGHQYRYVVGPAVGPLPQGPARDFSIDPGHLKRCLDDAGISLP